MYIQTWLVIILVIVGIYYFNRLIKRGNQNMTDVFKEKFSYKLDITIESNWYNIYKKLRGIKSTKEFDKVIDKKLKKANHNFDLWGRRYHFTEYYDSASGLTSRFQEISLTNGKKIFSTIDKFGDAGFVFDSDNKFNNLTDNKGREAINRLSIQVGEDFICNDIFDKYIGGPKIESDYKKENYLFQFPLSDVFDFLFALGQRFHGLETHTIVEWPDYIKKKFKKLGIKYETYFDYDPEIFNIEKYDKKFFEEIGKPKVAAYSGEIFPGAYLVSKDGTYYWIRLRLFRPGENERIAP